LQRVGRAERKVVRNGEQRSIRREDDVERKEASKHIHPNRTRAMTRQRAHRSESLPSRTAKITGNAPLRKQREQPSSIRLMVGSCEGGPIVVEACGLPVEWIIRLVRLRDGEENGGMENVRAHEPAQRATTPLPNPQLFQPLISQPTDEARKRGRNEPLAAIPGIRGSKWSIARIVWSAS
jgi:hypothetical protein